MRSRRNSASGHGPSPAGYDRSGDKSYPRPVAASDSTYSQSRSATQPHLHIVIAAQCRGVVIAAVPTCGQVGLAVDSMTQEQPNGISHLPGIGFGTVLAFPLVFGRSDKR